MTVNVYAIRDVHTGFMSPTVDRNDESAKRNFSMMVNNNPGVIGFRPGDFDLYLIGEFDVDAGTVTGLTVPVLVINGAACVGDIK